MVKADEHAGTQPIRDYSRFDRFLTAIAQDVYPELPSELHTSITRATIESMHREGMIRPGDKILDIGCGQGVALELFQELGMRATGITLGSDYDVCRAKGYDVHEMDQNFMTFPDRAFDALWCRHVLEHSIAPYYTIAEYCRVTKPGGLIYVEVPAADTSVRHEQGENHYSVLPLSSWMNLFSRVRCNVERFDKIKFTLASGADEYWSFILRTPQAG